MDACVRVGGTAFKGLTKQIGIKSIEKQLLKEAKRVAKEMNKARKSTAYLINKAQAILKPSGKLVGKQIGNNPAIRTITESEAKNMIDQFIKAGAKKASQQPMNYKGTWYELPGLGGFGIRTKSSLKSTRYGTNNTIDLKIDSIRDLGIKKLKY